VYYKNTVEK